MPGRARHYARDMKITKQKVVLDAADLEGTAAFWSDLTGKPITHRDVDWREIAIDDTWAIAIQLAPDHEPPEWPNGRPQQIHLDLYVDDVDAAQKEVLELGGRILDEQLDDPDGGFVVYADPAGHPFCLCK